MNRSRLIAATGGAVTLLLTAGTALALAISGDGVDQGGAVAAGQTGAVSTTETSESTSESRSESTSETSESTSESTGSGTSETSPSESSSTVHTAPPADPAIDSALAIDIALSHVGGGVVTNVEREVEHGRLEWKIRIERGGNRYDVRVDAATGAVTRVDAKDDDGGKGRGGDDDGDDDKDDRYDDRDRGHDDRSGRG